MAHYYRSTLYAKSDKCFAIIRRRHRLFHWDNRTTFPWGCCPHNDFMYNDHVSGHLTPEYMSPAGGPRTSQSWTWVHISRPNPIQSKSINSRVLNRTRRLCDTNYSADVWSCPCHDPDLWSCLVESSKATGRPQRRPVDRVCWAGIVEPPKTPNWRIEDAAVLSRRTLIYDYRGVG